MSQITIDQIRRLREQTGAPIMDCRTALQEAQGKLEKALEILKKKGLARAEKKKTQELKAGLIESYTHNTGRVGVLVEVLCETDFVARNSEFKNLVHELALQVASMDPKNVEELLKQSWIRDENQKIADLIGEKIAKFGENIVIGRFSRYQLGEGK